MPVEVAKIVDDFNKLWPRGTDPVSKADDHIRMIKEVLQLEFELLYNKTRIFSFEKGAVVKPDCILYYEAERAFYQWNGAYDVNNKYIVYAGSTPKTAGGIGGNAWTRSTGSGFMSAVLVSDTEPTAPFQNMLWWDTNSGVFFIYYNDGTSTQWVDLFGIADQSTFNTLLFRSILARLAAESGYTLVGGSFQEGAISSGFSDVVLDWNTAKFYQWHLDEAKTVAAGSTPTNIGIDWLDRSDITFRNELAFNTLDISTVSLNEAKTQFTNVIVGLLEYDKPAIQYYPNEDSIELSTQSVNQKLVNDLTGVTYPPNPQDYTGLNKHYFNNVFSVGSNAFGDNDVRRTTVFGSFNCQTPISWNFVDVYGMNSMSFAQYASRITALGTETFVWAGASSKQHLIDCMHDFWRQTSENQYTPGDTNWNYDGLETLHVGVGVRINSFTDYATSEEDFEYNVAVGRDSGNHIVKGSNNTFTGYQCAAHLFSGNYNTLYGLGAGRNGVFNDYITGFGAHALRDSIDSPNATALGYGAGRTVKDASFSTMIGERAADGVLSAKRSVLIGSQAGRGHPTALDDKLIINNQDDATRAPLISGDFSSSFVGHNIQPENIRAFNHFRIGDSGSSLVPTSAHNLLLEGNSVAGITIETTNAGFGRIQFADAGSLGSGAIEYSHASDTLNFTSGGTNRWRLTSVGNFRPIIDNSVSVGEASYRPSVIFAASGTINTSDEDCKTFCDSELSDAVLDVWASIDWRSYRFNDVIEEKGVDSARVHFGLGAQTVKAAFEAAGLDAFKYGLLCYDEWDATDAETITVTIGNLMNGDSIVKENIDSISANNMIEIIKKTSADANPTFVETSTEVIEVSPAREAGSRYGIRYEEALALEAALQRRTTQRLEARISALEPK